MQRLLRLIAMRQAEESPSMQQQESCTQKRTQFSTEPLSEMKHLQCNEESVCSLNDILRKGFAALLKLPPPHNLIIDLPQKFHQHVPNLPRKDRGSES